MVWSSFFDETEYLIDFGSEEVKTSRYRPIRTKTISTVTPEDMWAYCFMTSL